MRLAIGLKSHSGWAALVAIGDIDGELRMVDRRRIELIRPRDVDWAKQPYHAAEMLAPKEAEKLIKRAFASAEAMAVQALEYTVDRYSKDGWAVTACGIIVPAPMPDWSVADILAVHIRMHKAEGVVFPEVIARAADACRIPSKRVPEKTIDTAARAALGRKAGRIMTRLDTLGKQAGPPWGKDQKLAALAALTVLHA